MPAREKEPKSRALPGRKPPIHREQVSRDPQWQTIKEIVSRKFQAEPDLLRLFRSKQQSQFFREFFRGRLDIVQDRGSARFDALTNRYLNPVLPSYNPGLFDQAGPILMTITAETQKLAPRHQGGQRK